MHLHTLDVHCLVLWAALQHCWTVGSGSACACSCMHRVQVAELRGMGVTSLISSFSVREMGFTLRPIRSRIALGGTTTDPAEPAAQGC
jgi:hypothetical protein